MSEEISLTCAACGNEELEGSRFCGNCGASLPSDELRPDETSSGSAEPLTCASCGNEEPAGSRFCGTCGAPLAEPDHRAAATAAIPLATPIVTPVAPPVTRHRGRWVAAGVAGLLLVAGGAVAAALALGGGEDSSSAVSTSPLSTTSGETVSATPTLEASVSPRLQEIAAAQAVLNARIGTLSAGVESFAAARQAADALAAGVVRTQGFVDGLAPADATETATLTLLRRALAAHLVYADAISGLPGLPRSLTSSQAQAAIALARLAEVAYSSLAATDAALPRVSIDASDHFRLAAVVPSSKPPVSAARRSVDLAPLLVGIRPDDPLGEGRCFGPYTSRASLRVSGVVHHVGFVQCGDDANGDPTRATGIYRFSGPVYPGQSRLVRITGQAAIDESSSASQRGSRVTWTVIYDGTPVCSETVIWSGSRPVPKGLDCKIPAAASSGGLDVGRLRIQQVASPASSGSFWAGLLNPTIVVEPL